MRVSVIIPTLHGDTPVLRDAVNSLTIQTQAPAQVLLSIDSECAPAPSLSSLDDVGVETRIIRGSNAGPATARNRALEVATGDFVLFLNDDVVPAIDCIESHIACQKRCNAMVVGAAPWRFDRTPRRVIDRVVAETSFIFFYDQMEGRHAQHDWGFRHAWTLNLSVPRAECQRFDQRFNYPMYDDLEWAFRMAETGQRVHYAPKARVQHCHRPLYTPQTLLRREACIGHQAHVLCTVSPECFRATYACKDKPGFAKRSLTSSALTVARVSFADFASIAHNSGTGVNIAAVFEGCRSWRDAARSIGWELAQAGIDANAAADAALQTIDPPSTMSTIEQVRVNDA